MAILRTALLASALVTAFTSYASAQTPLADFKNAGETKLRLNTDGGFYLTGVANTGDLPITGEGIRLMWFPAKWAFRAGRLESSVSTYWDLANIGSGSAAMGHNTRASGDYSFAANFGTTASGASAVAFGNSSTASGIESFSFNGTATGDYAVAIGRGPQATGESSLALGASAISGGLASIALGPSTANGTFGVAIGLQNSASGSFSVALGTKARTANRQGSIVLGDNCGGSLSDSVYPTANNQFIVRGCGGIKFFTSQNVQPGFSTGVEVAAGGGSWSSISDVNRKANFMAVDGEALLVKLRDVAVQSWNYKTQDVGIRHIGPTAQDLHAAFGYGESNMLINTVDIDGINLAAIKALEARTDALARENAELKARLERLEKLLNN